MLFSIICNFKDHLCTHTKVKPNLTDMKSNAYLLHASYPKYKIFTISKISQQGAYASIQYINLVYVILYLAFLAGNEILFHSKLMITILFFWEPT